MRNAHMQRQVCDSTAIMINQPEGTDIALIFIMLIAKLLLY